jgi:MFS superfamily sulfate permease-like transporter
MDIKDVWNCYIAHHVLYGQAIASIALSHTIDPHRVMGAGIGTSAVVLLLSITGLLHWAAQVVPLPVVKGIQVGAGLSLILNAGAQVKGVNSYHDNWLLALVAFVALYATSRRPRFPIALVLFSCGLFISLSYILFGDGWDNLPHFGFYLPRLDIPSSANIKQGFLSAGIGQVPLTVLNSVIAVSSLCHDLLPSQPTPSVTYLGIRYLSCGLRFHVSELNTACVLCPVWG